MVRKIHFDDAAKGLLVIILISQLFLTNGILLFAGTAIFFVLFSKLQQPFKPSVFTIMLFYHFLQISAGIWLSNYLGKDINYRSPSSTYAIITANIGLLFLFLPIIYYQNKIPSLSNEQFKKYANRLSIDRTLKAYVIIFFSMSVLNIVSSFIPSLSQIFISLANIKWVLFFYHVFISHFCYHWF